MLRLLSELLMSDIVFTLLITAFVIYAMIAQIVAFTR